MRNFRNLSGDAAQDYFANGVTQEIRDQMSRINGLRLLSAGAVGRYADGQNRRLVAETGAGSIVEGAVRVADGRVRVDVELIDGRSEQTLWSDKFERKMEDIFTVQSDVAASIAGALKTRFSGGEQTQSAKRPTANIEAYDLYLRSQRMRRNREFNEKAMEMLRRAIELDPRFAEAMAELSRRNLSRVYYADTSQTQQALDWANKAIAIVPGSHRAYLALGENYSVLGRSESARAAFARCLELSPNNQECMNDIADLDMELGRFEEALQWSRKALLLSPNIGNPYYHVGTAVDLFGDPGVIEKWLSLHEKRFAGEAYRAVKGMAMLELGRVADALAEARMIVESAPQSDSGRAVLAEMAFLTRAHDAEALTEPFFRNGPDPRFTNWPLMPHSARSRYAYLLLKRGDRQRALTMLEEARKAIEAYLAEGIDSPLAFEELAAIHAMRGDKPSALREYRRAYNAGWRLVTLTSLNPMLDPLRSDPEFQQVVSRMKSDVARMRSESKELRELQEKTIPFLQSLPLPGR